MRTNPPGAGASIAALSLGLVSTSLVAANGASANIPGPSPAAAASAASDAGSWGGRPVDACAIVSKNDVASAAGVTTGQVYVPTQPTKTECVWAVAGHGGAPAQRVALTVQTVDQVKAAHGMARFGTLLSAFGNIPGVPLPNNPIVTRAFADAQVVAGLGDRAGWKNGTLSVLKKEALYEVTATGQPTDAASLHVARAIAQSALTHADVTAATTPTPIP